MAKLRKMLGDVNGREAAGLMGVIETQSLETLAGWAMDYVKARCIPIFEKHHEKEERIENVLGAADACLNGKISLKEAKKAFADGRKAAQEMESQPIAQAAARAIVTACAVLSTPTNALGFAFYAAAACAYDAAGLSAPPDVYDRLAQEEMGRILESLQQAAVENEMYPVKVNWNC